MSSGLDSEFVRETYRKMPDDELVRVATQDAAGLTPEAQEIVKEEVARRGLDKNIVHGVRVQNKELTDAELNDYCLLASTLDCPNCGSSLIPLNGTMTSEVVSVILFTQCARKIKVACPDCLDKANTRALVKSVTLGWWGIPWGIVRTVQAIAQNLNCKKTNRSGEHNRYLKAFVSAKVGQFETYKDNREKLQEILLDELGWR
jgi:hypothetical protein